MNYNFIVYNKVYFSINHKFVKEIYFLAKMKLPVLTLSDLPSLPL